MNRRLIGLLLAVLLCVSALAPAAAAYNAGASWSAPCRAFILDDGFRKQGRSYSNNAEYPIRFTLYDLDGDDCPEVFVRDPLRAMIQDPFDVYTFRSGKPEYIGRIGTRGGTLHYAPGRGYDGVFCYDGTLDFFVGSYYTMENGSLVTQRIVETDGNLRDTWITADEDLKKAFRAAYDGPVTKYTEYGELPSFTATEIRALTWERFAGGSGALARFYDVYIDNYFAPAVGWAAECEVTDGTAPAAFTPNKVCTRAQTVTFLWRAAGSPKPEGEAVPFTDVPAGSYYADAVRWAVARGITDGVDKTHFAPNASVTRAQIVTFLWRLEKEPAPGESTPPFKDVPAARYFAAPVAWAAEQGITDGVEPGLFKPNQACIRCQIVTFLFRAIGYAGVAPKGESA